MRWRMQPSCRGNIWAVERAEEETICGMAGGIVLGLWAPGSVEVGTVWRLELLILMREILINQLIETRLNDHHQVLDLERRSNWRIFLGAIFCFSATLCFNVSATLFFNVSVVRCFNVSVVRCFNISLSECTYKRRARWGRPELHSETQHWSSSGCVWRVG